MGGGEAKGGGGEVAQEGGEVDGKGGAEEELAGANVPEANTVVISSFILHEYNFSSLQFTTHLLSPTMKF